MTHPRLSPYILLPLVGACAVGCGGDDGPSIERRDAWIREHRERLEGGKKLLHLYSTINTNVLLTELAGMPEVEQIVFEETVDLSEEGLRQLKSFPNLRLVEFHNEDAVDDSALQYITACDGLETVSFVGKTWVTEAGLRQLEAELPECEISIKEY